MPQTNVIPDWKLTYPNDAKAQKPGGVTVSTALGATAVPNKPTYAAGTIQIAEVSAETETVEAEGNPGNPGEDEEEAEEEPKPKSKRKK